MITAHNLSGFSGIKSHRLEIKNERSKAYAYIPILRQSIYRASLGLTVWMGTIYNNYACRNMLAC